MTKLDDIILKPAHWQEDDYKKAKQQIQALVKELNLSDEQIERASQLGLWDEKE